jgi:hypothetical protein
VAQVVTVEVEVTVLKRREGTEKLPSALQVTDGTVQRWVPVALIDDTESEIRSGAEPGDAGLLVIPEWKAVELGLVL